MNITTSLKTLPLITALGMSLTLAPTVSMADRERGHGREHYAGYEKHQPKKHHGKLARKHGREHGWKHGRRHDRHAYYPRHEEVIVYDYRHQPHRRFAGFDNLRFMIGLHTGNVDLVIRD